VSAGGEGRAHRGFRHRRWRIDRSGARPRFENQPLTLGPLLPQAVSMTRPSGIACSAAGKNPGDAGIILRVFNVRRLRAPLFHPRRSACSQPYPPKHTMVVHRLVQPNAHRFFPRSGPACPSSFTVVSIFEKRNNLQQVSALSPIPARILPFSPTQPALQILP
jgi:hypothetical protein